MEGTSNGTPILSLILPVYNAKPYLEKCLDSILNQSFRDIEVIAVDGASDDGSVQELRSRASGESRLKVLPDEIRIGPGVARNRGADLARGEYLWFVDADDVITPDCIRDIVNAVKAAPDVLFVGYEIVQRFRRKQPSPVRGLPSALDGARFTIADHPEVLKFSMAAWNKIIRREFFTQLGLGFEDQWPHEDVRLSAQLILEAGNLGALSRICYRYRRNRPGSAMRGPEAMRHFKSFKAWQLVLDWAQIRAKVDDPLVTCGVYRALFERAIYHYSTLLDTRGYIPRPFRREFFVRMTADFKKYAPPDYQLASGLRGIKLKLIRDGSYGRYSILDPINRARNGLKIASRLVGANFH